MLRRILRQSPKLIRMFSDKVNERRQSKLTKDEEIKQEERIRSRVFTGIQLPHVRTAEQITESLQITGVGDNCFQVNNQIIPGSILIFPKRCFIWGVAQPNELKAHTLEILKYLKPKPSISLVYTIAYLIVGTGKEFHELPQEFHAYFKEYEILVDVVSTVSLIFEYRRKLVLHLTRVHLMDSI